MKELSGAWFSNLHIKATSQEAVIRLMKEEHRRAFVSPEMNGWVGVFDAESHRDLTSLVHLAALLSEALETWVLALQVENSQILHYVLCSYGDIRDSYRSGPAYHGSSFTICERVVNSPELLAGLCPAGGNLDEMRALLDGQMAVAGSDVQAEDRLEELARCLNICNWEWSYHHLEIAGRPERVTGWPGFWHSKKAEGEE